MPSTTGSRLVQAAIDYDKATAKLAFFVPSNANLTRKADHTVPIPRMEGARMARPTHDEDSDTSIRGGNSLEAWDAMAQNAYAAGRTLERCIQEHRFGRKEPVTHKFYGAEGERRVTKDEARAMGHNFPESTPWLP